MLPLITLIRITTPRYVSHQLSTKRHLRSSLRLPLGLGNLFTICSKINSTPSPVLPEQGTASSVSMPITSSICFLDRSKSEAGKSILFKTGIIS